MKGYELFGGGQVERIARPSRGLEARRAKARPLESALGRIPDVSSRRKTTQVSVQVEPNRLVHECRSPPIGVDPSVKDVKTLERKLASLLLGDL